MKPLELKNIYPTPVLRNDFFVHRSSICTNRIKVVENEEINLMNKRNAIVNLKNKIEIKKTLSNEINSLNVERFSSILMFSDDILWGDNNNLEFQYNHSINHLNNFSINSLNLEECLPSIKTIKSSLEDEVCWNDDFIETIPLIDFGSNILVDSNINSNDGSLHVENNQITNVIVKEYLQRIGSDNPWRNYKPIIRHINENFDRLDAIDCINNCDIVSPGLNIKQTLNWHKNQFNLKQISSKSMVVKVPEALKFKLEQRNLLQLDPHTFFNDLDFSNNHSVTPIKFAQDIRTDVDDLILCEYVEKYPLFILERGMKMKLVRYIHQTLAKKDEQEITQMIDDLKQANLPNRKVQFFNSTEWFDRGELRYLLPKEENDLNRTTKNVNFELMEESPFFGEFNCGEQILQMQTNLFSSLLIKQKTCSNLNGLSLKCENPFFDFLLIHNVDDGCFYIRELPDIFVAEKQEPRRHVQTHEHFSSRWKIFSKLRILLWIRSMNITFGIKSVTFSDVCKKFPEFEENDFDSPDINKLISIRGRNINLTKLGEETLRSIINGETTKFFELKKNENEISLPEHFMLQDSTNVYLLFYQRRHFLNIPISGNKFDRFFKQIRLFLTQLANYMDADSFENDVKQPHVGLTLIVNYLLEVFSITLFKQLDAYKTGFNSRKKILPTFLSDLRVVPTSKELKDHFQKRYKESFEEIQRAKTVTELEDIDYSFSERLPPNNNHPAKIKPAGIFSYQRFKNYQGETNKEDKKSNEEDGRSISKSSCIHLLKDVLNDGNYSVEELQQFERWDLQKRVNDFMGKLDEDKYSRLRNENPILKTLTAPKKKKLNSQIDNLRIKLNYFTKSTMYDITLRELLNKERINKEKKNIFC
eukprot:TRINITY_DN4908_c0_g1_i1.p1 TRINITY_DN4908_c0_g1~~TRINITY_DN4908_c0_g1_i1.p1  ORF type:complete len:873 (-),score=231.52 TRINITY_DN4908_c0_g1_i1:121-2739(-)